MACFLLQRIRRENERDVECQQDSQFSKTPQLDFRRREFQRNLERQCNDPKPGGSGNYQNAYLVRFEVFTEVAMKNGVFWDVTPRDSCKNRCFGGT
jgi:hypothetical protein